MEQSKEVRLLSDEHMSYTSRRMQLYLWLGNMNQNRIFFFFLFSSSATKFILLIWQDSDDCVSYTNHSPTVYKKRQEMQNIWYKHKIPAIVKSSQLYL